MNDFSLRIDSFYAAYSIKVPGCGLLQDSVAVVRIAPVFRLAGFRAKGINDFRKSHFIRFANTQVDDLRTGMGGHGGSLGTFYLFEFVNGGGLSVLAPTNAFGKQVLNVRFGHKCRGTLER